MNGMVADIGPSEALATLFTPEGKADPYPFYDALRTLGPVVSLGSATAFVLGYEELAVALRDERLLVTDEQVHRRTGMIAHSSWQCFTKIMMFSNGSDHQRLRQFSKGTFTPRHVERLRVRAQQQCDEVLRKLSATAAGTRCVDLVTEFSFLFPITVTGELLGIPEADRMRLRETITACTTAFEPISDLAELGGADVAMDRLLQYIAALIQERRCAPRDDLTSALVLDRDRSGQLSDDELVAYLVLLLISGSQTPSDLIGNCIQIALNHPAQAAEILSNPNLVPAFIIESLRWDAPVQALTRVAAQDLDLCGTPIAKDSRLLLFIGAANRDGARFDEPDKFDLHRSRNQPLAFGLGQHHCLGATFARMLGEVAVPTFLRHFPAAAMAEPPSYRDQLVQRGFARFPVSLQ